MANQMKLPVKEGSVTPLAIHQVYERINNSTALTPELHSSFSPVAGLTLLYSPQLFNGIN